MSTCKFERSMTGDPLLSCPLLGQQILSSLFRDIQSSPPSWLTVNAPERTCRRRNDGSIII